MRLFIAAAVALAATALRLAPPAPFAPGVISTDHEFTITFTPDGREAYFTRSSASPRWTHVMHSIMKNGAWQQAEPANFSGDGWADLDPAMSPDGSRLYFVSTRPRPSPPASSPPPTALKADMDIWYVDRVGDQWGAPHWIPELSSDSKEGSPTVDRMGTLCFFSDRNAQPNDNAIYCAERSGGGWSAPVRLNASVNAGPSDTSPFLSPDGNALLFYSTRAGGMGQADLYLSVKRGGEWQPAANLGGAVNGPGFDYNPSVSPDGNSFYFGRSRGIYVVPMSELDPQIITPAMFR